MSRSDFQGLQIIRNLESILREFPNGAMISDVNLRYQSKFGHNIEKKKHGLTIKEALDLVPNLVCSGQQGKGVYRLADSFIPAEPVSLSGPARDPDYYETCPRPHTLAEVAEFRTAGTSGERGRAVGSVVGSDGAENRRPAAMEINIPQDMRRKIVRLLERYPDGIDVRKFGEEYVKRYGIAFSVNKECGCTAKDLFANLPEAECEFRNDAARTVIVRPRGQAVDDDLSTADLQQEIAVLTASHPARYSPANSAVLDELEVLGDVLLRRCPQGAPLHRLTTIFKDDRGRAVSEQLREEEALYAAICDHPEYFRVDMEGPVPRVSSALQPPEEPFPPRPAFASASHAFTFSLLAPSTCIKAKVQEVVSPKEFYVMDCAREPAYLRLIANLSEFYAEQGGEAALRPGELATLLPVGVYYAAQFERALVVSVPAPGQVRVLFVDYGTTTDVGVGDVRRLPVEYLREPAFALHLSTPSVQPPESGCWSGEALETFYNLVLSGDVLISTDDAAEANITVGGISLTEAVLEAGIGVRQQAEAPVEEGEASPSKGAQAGGSAGQDPGARSPSVDAPGQGAAGSESPAHQRDGPRPSSSNASVISSDEMVALMQAMPEAHKQKLQSFIVLMRERFEANPAFILKIRQLAERYTNAVREGRCMSVSKAYDIAMSRSLQDLLCELDCLL